MGQSVARIENLEPPTRKEIETGAVAGLLGGLVSSVLLVVGSGTVERLAGVFGFVQTVGNGWGTYVLLSVVLGLAFALVVTQLVDRYVAFVVSLTSRSDLARRMVMPLTNRFGMRVVVTTAMGLLYGLIMGVVFLGVLIPLRVNSVALLQVDGVGLLGFVVYGILLGITYGQRVA
jgi:hypothetical protein